MFAIRKSHAFKRSAPRAVLKRGYWVLRTVDPYDPYGPALDPETGMSFRSLDAAIPPGWKEAFRDEYLPGVQRARGYKSWVSVFPHEVVLVDPKRYDVVLSAEAKITAASIATRTCVPAWICPITK